MGLAIDFNRDIKVCLNNKLVKHRFVYFEDWIHVKGKLEDDSFEENTIQAEDAQLTGKDGTARKYLRAVYFGRYVNRI